MAIRFHWLLIPLLLAGAPDAQAEETKPMEAEVSRGHILVGGKMPASRAEVPEIEVSSRRPAWMDVVHLHRKSGVEVRRSFRMGQHDVILGVKGPLLKKNRLGLTFVLKF